jgi:hypothetical protein
VCRKHFFLKHRKVLHCGPSFLGLVEHERGTDFGTPQVYPDVTRRLPFNAALAPVDAPCLLGTPLSGKVAMDAAYCTGSNDLRK